MSSFLHRLPPASGNGIPDGPAAAGEWSSSFPALAEFLAATSWSDASPRTPGTLTLFTDGSSWKICLSDKAQSLVAFVTGLSPLEAFQAAERGLVSNCLDWRASSPTNRNRRR